MDTVRVMSIFASAADAATTAATAVATVYRCRCDHLPLLLLRVRSVAGCGSLPSLQTHEPLPLLLRSPGEPERRRVRGEVLRSEPTPTGRNRATSQHAQPRGGRPRKRLQRAAGLDVLGTDPEMEAVAVV